MNILYVCLLGLTFEFLHYGVFPSQTRSKRFIGIEIFRFLTYFLICYYYCDRASGVLPNRRKYKLFLQVLFPIVVTFIVVFGYILIRNINDGTIQASELCVSIYFELYRYFPLLSQLVFMIMVIKIQNKINSLAENS